MKALKTFAIAIAALGLAIGAAQAENVNPSEGQQNIPIHRDFDQSMRAMRDEMDRMFQDFFSKKDDVTDWGSGAYISSPATDVIEQDKQYVVKVELPGLSADGIDLSVTGNTIVIKGEKKQENQVKSQTFLREETSYGSFSSSVTLPDGADIDKADAVYKNGVLTITVPKNPAVAPKSRKLTIRQ